MLVPWPASEGADYGPSRRKAALHRTAPKAFRGRPVVTALLGAAIAVCAAGTALTAPSVGDLRAQVARIQAEVGAIDDRVEDAAEAYNGAVWRLDQVNERITENQRALVRANRDLKRGQAALATRLRLAYVQPPPTRLQLVLSSGSISSMLGGVDALERASAQDANIVRAVRELRQRRIATGRQLVKDRSAAKREVTSRAAERAKVESLLRRRQAVLAGAKGQLGRLLAAERARERREAEAARRIALERARSAAAPASSSQAAAPAQASGEGSAASPSSGSSAPAGGGAVVSGAGSAANAQAARLALQYLGVPYRWGGASPSSGFDCSGLANYVYGKVGKYVPHYTGAIWAKFPRVQGPLQPGDMVFFRGLGHMGIYLGGGQMVHAPRTGDVVKVTSMSSRSDFVGAVRP